jgi:transposase
VLGKEGMGKAAAIPRRSGGRDRYYERVSLAEQNERLRERLRRKEWDATIAEAEKNEALEENEALQEELRGALRRIRELEEENQKLKRMLRPAWVKDASEDTHLPEGLKQSKPQKIGAQPGHPAHRRTVPRPIDRHVKFVADHCPSCEGKLPAPVQWHTHTQTDLPDFTPAITTQYHVGWSYCSRCRQKVAVAEKLDRSKYGPRLHSFVGYLKFGMGMTLPKIQELLKEQYRLEIGTGELSELLSSDAARFLHSVEDGIRGHLARERGAVCADETSWRKAGKGAWLWSFSSSEWSYYTIEKGRSRDVVARVLGSDFQGILSSDFLGSYSFQPARAKQKCWVHLLRECRELRVTKYPGHPEIQAFGRQIRRFYERGCALARKKRRHERYKKQYRRLMADTERFASRPWEHPELKTLAKRLHHHRDALYTFIWAEIPPHNNAAEREIRPAVLMRKTSYGNRSDRGAATQAIWMSLIRSLKKQGKPFLPAAVLFLQIT